jgi:hypothetical protein
MTFINETMSTYKLCSLQPLSNDPIGTPVWLFDYHQVDRKTRAYAWFPKESNYTDHDLALSFILGVSCTPHLGPVQYDEWQWYPGLTKGNTIIDPWTHPRVSPRTIHGNSEVNVLEEQLRLVLPDYFETDPRALHRTNVAPLNYRPRSEEMIIPTVEEEFEESVYSGTQEALELIEQQQTEEQSRAIVIASGSRTTTDTPSGKRQKIGTRKVKRRVESPVVHKPLRLADRFRILIYVYTSTIVWKSFTTTRLAALKTYLNA